MCVVSVSLSGFLATLVALIFLNRCERLTVDLGIVSVAIGCSCVLHGCSSITVSDRLEFVRVLFIIFF